MENESKKQQMFDNMKRKKKEVKIVRRIVSVIVLIALIVIGIGGYSGYKYVSSALKPVDPNATDEIAIEVPMGSGVTLISKILEKNGVVKNAQIF